MERKLFALGLLVALGLVGCSESKDETVAACNNGVLEEGEICDGKLFDMTKRKCPEGTVLATGKQVLDITCSDACTLVTEGVCVTPETPKTCGNGALDAGEACDGDAFADGKRECPSGMVYASGKTSADITCSSACTVETTGICVTPETPKTCGNGTLDEGEACDGDAFADGKRECPSGMDYAPGKTSADITCSSECTVETTGVCVTQETPKACGNGILDEGEACDKDVFADGKRVCPSGMDYAPGKTSADITCSPECTVETTGVCVTQETPKACGNGILDEGEACDKDAFADGKRVCPNGYFFKEGKTANDIVCTDKCEVDTKAACDNLTSRCDGNTYILCDQNGECESEDCSEKNLVCAIGLDGELGCTEETCTEINAFKCVGNTLYMCIEETEGGTTGRWLSDACKEHDKDLECVTYANGTSDCNLPLCETKGAVRCDGMTAYSCEEDGEVNRWLGEDCSEKGMICETGKGCVEPLLCGNGVVDTGEACDYTDKGAVFPTYTKVDCYYYAGADKSPSNILYKSGAPSCTSKCAVSIENCVPVTEEDYTDIKKWTFTSQSVINNLTKSGEVVMTGVFGSGNSEYSSSDNGWSLGNWSNGAFGHALTFSVGAVKSLGVNVKLTVRRTKSASPKMMKIQLLSGNKTIATSGAFSLNSDTKVQVVDYSARLTSSMEDFKVRVTAYDTTSEQHIVIKDVTVSGADVL